MPNPYHRYAHSENIYASFRPQPRLGNRRRRFLSPFSYLLTPAEPLCDDGNTVSGNGCSSTCKEEPGWGCSGTPSTCTHAVSGNGKLEAGEGCDDGNTLPFDGCSPTCQADPRCGTFDTQGKPTSAVGACKSLCGDGILLRGGSEECDDGNTLDGDGCSHDCKQEAGFTCVSAYDAPPTSPDCGQGFFGNWHYGTSGFRSLLLQWTDGHRSNATRREPQARQRGN